jgi:GAF domain-containing protein
MRLLIVDDREGYRDHLRQFFSEEGYQVVTAASGKEALAVLERDWPDVVITDIVMPRGDGFFLLEHIGDKGLQCPVIVITAYGSQESAVRALRLGAYDYVTKPFDLDVMLATVNRAAEYCRLQQAVSEGQRALAAQVSETSALYDTALDLVSFLSLPKVLESLLSRAVALLDATGGNVCLYDESRQRLTVAASHGPWEDIAGRTQALDEGLAGKVARSGRSLCVDDYSNWEGRLAWYEAAGLTCVVGVPLMLQDRVVGVLNVVDDAQRGGFSQADEDLLLRLAPLAALAIERARMHSQTEAQLDDVRRAHQEINALQDLTAAIQSSLALPDVLNRIAEGVVQGLGYLAAMVAVYDPQRDALVVQSAAPDAELWAKGEALTGVGMIGASLTMDHQENLAVRSARRGEMAFTHDLADLFRPAVDEETAHVLQQMAGVRALATVPLMANGQLVGNFFAGSDRDGFSEADTASLKAFARQAALAIEHARLYAEAERNWREHRYLREISDVFNSTLDLEEVLTLVMTKTNELLGVEAGSVTLLTEDRQELVFHASVGEGAEVVKGLKIPAQEGFVGWVVSHGESLLVPDVDQDPRHFDQVDAASGFKTRSVLCVPLVAKGGVIGAIEVLNKIGEPFDADDLRLTEALALSAATAIEKARLYQGEKQALEQLRQTQDELMRAQRLAVLGQIGVTVRHEVNNPLTVVLGNADWLLRELTDLDGEALSALKAIRANALRIRDTVKKLEDIQTDRVAEHLKGVQMIDIHNQHVIDREEGDTA